MKSRLVLLALGLALALPFAASAEKVQIDTTANTVRSAPANLTPVAGGQFGLTVASSTALTVPATATIAVIGVEGQSVRWRDDGPAPTASVGQVLAPGDTLVYAADLASLRLIQTAATATLNVSYYK